MPPEWQLDGPTLRLWALTAGAPDGRGGYLLGLDPHAPQTHQALVAATTRAGIAARRASAVRYASAAPDGWHGLVELVGSATRPDARRSVAALSRSHGVLNQAP